MNETGNREKPKMRFWWQQNRGEMSSQPNGNTEMYLFNAQDGD